ncbi:kinase-like domain-containing protein [Tanacetum coccineum]
MKLCGPGDVAREGIPFELFRSTYPGRHVARERYPQRQVARDTPDLSLGNMANVVVYVQFNILIVVEGHIQRGVLSIICLTFATVSASYGGNETDYLALLSFKSKITQDPHKVLTLWNHSFHFCDWSGISCGKRHKRVIALRLVSQGLEGSLLPHVGNLSFLRVLSLGNNSFQGAIPHELGRLSRLRGLYLSLNKFSGVIPTNLSGCSNLDVLLLIRNKLVGSIPKEMSLLSSTQLSYAIDDIINSGIPTFFLGKITSMAVFSAHRNLYRVGTVQITLVYGKLDGFGSGVLPISIGNLSDKLSFLSLGNNHLFGSLPSSIGPTLIPSRELIHVDNRLYLYSNNLENHIPSSLGNCKELNGLNLAHNRLSGKIPKKLLQLPSLTNFLQLSYNNMSGSIPSQIKDLKLLTGLDLSYNNLSGTITSSLGECVSLTTLNLQGNQFQGLIPSSLSSLGGLGVLDISQNSLSGKIPQFLDKWKLLKYLNLSFNDFEGEVPIVGVFANASSFSVLGNNGLCGGLVTLELPKYKKTGTKNKRFPFFILVIVIAPTLLIVLCCVYLLYKKKRNSQPSQSTGSERFMKVSYNQLLKATDGFSTANLIGDGGFSSVYKGILDSDSDKSVAIKVLHLQNSRAHKIFLADCEAWRNIRSHLNQNSSTGVKGTIGYAPPEYGLGSEMTSSGDVYSFGILLLEVMTGKRPTEDMFKEGLSLHKFAYMALPDHVIDVIDDDAIVLQSTRSECKENEECLVATIKMEYHASEDSPPQRRK